MFNKIKKVPCFHCEYLLITFGEVCCVFILMAMYGLCEIWANGSVIRLHQSNMSRGGCKAGCVTGNDFFILEYIGK